MMHIVTKEGHIYLHNTELEAHFNEQKIEYSIVDTSVFPDIEWEFISALKLDHVHHYVTTKAAERVVKDS